MVSCNIIFLINSQVITRHCNSSTNSSTYRDGYVVVNDFIFLICNFSYSGNIMPIMKWYEKVTRLLWMVHFTPLPFQTVPVCIEQRNVEYSCARR